MRSRVRYAGLSGNEGKTPKLFDSLFRFWFRFQSFSIHDDSGYFYSLVDPPSLSFQMFLTTRAVIHVNFSFLGYREGGNLMN